MPARLARYVDQRGFTSHVGTCKTSQNPLMTMLQAATKRPLRSTLRIAFFFTGLVLLGADRAQAEQQLKSSDHKKLAKSVAEYFEAVAEKDGIVDALAELNKNVEKVEKKAKGVPFLSMVEDIEQIFYLSKDYSGSVRKGRVSTAAEPFFKGGEVEFAYHAPKSYKESKGPYPVLFCVPDQGVSPEEDLETNWIDADLRNGTIIFSVGMPADAGAQNTVEGGVGRLMTVVRFARKSFALDANRYFVAGRGSGVATAMHTADIFPSVFAGVIGRAGDMQPLSTGNFLNQPTYFAGGGAHCTAFEAEAKEKGWENVTLDPEGTEADAAAWMSQTARNANPMQVAIEPNSLFCSSSAWLSISGFEAGQGAKIEAKIEDNTITIDGRGIGTVTLFANDLLLDMDQPVTVICNGVKHEKTLPRSMTTTLDLAVSINDWGRVYTATHYYEMPIKGIEGE